MLVVAQLPFVDMRTFVDERGERLKRPTWPAPAVGYDFVRRFGAVAPTPGGGIQPWRGEEYFCKADSAIAFRRSPTREPNVRLEIVHKRLFFNGVIGRVELAFKTPDKGDIEQVARTVAGLRVRVRGAKECAFYAAGSPLSRLLVSSTTPVSKRSELRRTRLIVSGMPLVLIERHGIRGEGLAFPMEDPETGVLLEHVLTGLPGVPAGLWVVSHGTASDKVAVRAVRTHAVRLHSEYEAFASVLRACLGKDLEPARSTPLRDYLHTTSRRMLRASFEGLPQAAILAEMASARVALKPGESESLAAALQEISPSLRRLVLDAATMGAATPDVDKFVVNFNVNTINYHEGAVVTTNSNNIEVGQNAQIRGAVGTGSAVSNSSFGDGGGSIDQLGSLIASLLVQLEELNSRLDGGLDDDVELVRAAEEELQSPNPKYGRVRSFLSNAMRGIKEVGEVAKPVVETYDSIQGLLQ